MAVELHGLLFAISFLSTAHGFWVSAALLTTMPFLFDYHVFSDTILQPDDPATYAIVETCLAIGSFLMSLVGPFSALGSKQKQFLSLPGNILGVYYVIAFVASAVILALRLNKMGILAEWELADKSGTCADTSYAGNPIARLKSAGYEIETFSDCTFNAYDPDLQNINTFGSGSNDPILVDWANVMNYDASQAGVLAQAAQSAGAEDLDAAAMPLIHDYWYWGCDPICHPRSKLNDAWLAYSLVNVIVYLILLVVSFLTARASQTVENKGGFKKLDQADKSAKKGQTDDAGDEGGDEEEGEGGADEYRRRRFSSMRF
tara:strand:- start:799 stop:1749 length:951 start_codon:yes stop_codon:yes gene_type:complete